MVTCIALILASLCFEYQQHKKKMQGLKRFHLLGFLSFLLFPTSLSREYPSSHCGGIEIQPPLSSQNNSSSLSRIIRCESGTLYFRTSIGLFRISDIDYRSKLLTIVPHQLSAGFTSKISTSGKSELGTRISFDVPDHVPNLCDECRKRGGDCGVGLRCICHLENCKDKVFSVGAALRPCGEVFFYLVLMVVVIATLTL